MNMYYNEPLRQIPLKEYKFQSEAAMKFFLLDNTDLLCPEDLGFEDISIMGNEVALRNGEIAGRMDITAIYDGTTIGIIELKNVELTIDHLNQLTNYFTLTDELAERFRGLSIDSSMERFGLLVGPSISCELENKIKQGGILSNGTISAMILQRFRDDENGSYIFNRVINANLGRVIVYYTFNGSRYGVGRLVHAVIKKYVIDNPEVTLERLQTIFPRSLHGNYEIVVDESKPTERFNVIYFYREKDKITLQDGRKICVTRQWGNPIIGGFLGKAKELGYEITQN